MTEPLKFSRALLCVLTAPADGFYEARCPSYPDGKAVLRLPVEDVPEALRAKLVPDAYLTAEVTLHAPLSHVQVKGYGDVPEVPAAIEASV